MCAVQTAGERVHGTKRELGKWRVLNLRNWSISTKRQWITTKKYFGFAPHFVSCSTRFERFWQVFRKFLLSLGILVCRVLYDVSIILLLWVTGLSLCKDFASLYRGVCQTLWKFSLPCLEFWGLVGLTGTAIFLMACGLGLVYFTSVYFFKIILIAFMTSYVLETELFRDAT